MIQAAIDFWNGTGGFRLGDALIVLDDENVLALVKAMLHQREINFRETPEC